MVQQWGYSKDHKPDYIRREAEKMAYFMKLDDLDFLEETRSEYNFIDDDAKNAVGYVTDDEDDEIMEHPDYGKMYSDADHEYRDMILEDHCDGRPVYEWQVPYGLHQVYGYKSVETAVDVICNEAALENIKMEWKLNGGDNSKGLILENENTMQQLCLVDASSAPDAIKNWQPSTVVVASSIYICLHDAVSSYSILKYTPFYIHSECLYPCTVPLCFSELNVIRFCVQIQCGADKLLSQMKSSLAPTNRTDVYGCSVALAWSTAWFLSPLWPANVALSGLSAAALLALNGTFLARTFMHPHDQKLKKVFGAVRKAQANLVLGDWLLEDYDERLNQVLYRW